MPIKYTAPDLTVLPLASTFARYARTEVFWHSSKSTVLLGYNSRQVVTLDLKTAPHVLIAGTTGSGKSVMMHSMICSLLAKNTPSTAQLVFIDPKMIEYAVYDSMPEMQLYRHCITETDEAIAALKDLCDLMDNRYRTMKAKHQKAPDGPSVYVFVDELADLIYADRSCERYLVRLAQKARSADIHLILATQQPTTQTIPSILKANMPTRLSLRVAQGSDSRVILDHSGAELLKGKGDAIIKYGSSVDEVRFQGAWLSDEDREVFITSHKTDRNTADKAVEWIESKDRRWSKHTCAIGVITLCFWWILFGIILICG